MSRRNDPNDTGSKERDELEEILNAKIVNSGQSKIFNKYVVITAILVVLALLLGLLMGSTLLAKDSKSATSDKTDDTEVSQVKESVSGKSAEQDKKDALNSAVGILNSAATKDGKTEDRLKKIENGDMSSVPDEMKKKFDFVDSFSKDEKLKSVAFESVITMKDRIFKDGEAKASDDAWKSVELDSSKGIAWVPLGAIAGQDIPFTFEMVYKDGEWKLSPYSILESVKMSAMMGAAGTQPTK